MVGLLPLQWLPPVGQVGWWVVWRREQWHGWCRGRRRCWWRRRWL